LLTFFVDAGSITNQVVKTKHNHTCVLPTVVDKATNYLFLSNPQPGDIFEYCTLDHTGVLRKWPWCSYGKKFPEIENGVETFKWDYCTEYSWEYEGYKYIFKEATLKSSYKDAEEYCKSQGGELPVFEPEREKRKHVVYFLGDFMWIYDLYTPIYEGDSKTTLMEAMRPLLAYYKNSQQKGFWMKTEEIIGERIGVDKSKKNRKFTDLIEEKFQVKKCLTVSPLGDAKFVDCGKFDKDFADTLCRFSIEN